MVEGELFLQIQSNNIVYPNEENMIVVPMTKRMEIITGIHICHFSWMKFIYNKITKKKVFLASPKHKYHVSQQEKHDYSARNKKN